LLFLSAIDLSKNCPDTSKSNGLSRFLSIQAMLAKKISTRCS
jgi:hypothetical protein